MSNDLVVAGRIVGPGHPVYVIAEISANHGGSLERAVDLVRRAAEAGADAVKVQTYTPDTMTIDSDREPFRVGEDTLWAGRNLYELYREAQTPWEWYPMLQEAADRAGVTLFSSPFDATAVRFLVDAGAPVLKIASFEIVDLALIETAARTGKPLIMSTGMATAEEIDDAVQTAVKAGVSGLALLRCNSAYPAPASEMDLRTIPDMAERWRVPIGLSDHTLGMAAATAAVALGATLLEKHFTLDRAEPTADAAFSLEPAEFAALVSAVREAESALGTVRYGPSADERRSLAFRRSLFVVRDVAAGAVLGPDDVRAIRPGDGLPPKHLAEVVGRRAARDLPRGTPVTWDVLAD